MSSQVVTYQVDDSTTASFEIEPPEGFRPASPGHVAGKIRDAVAPAVEAAQTVLDKVKEARPDEIELTFGIKVSGTANWLIAKSAGEANFEVKLKWSPKDKLDNAQEPAEEEDDDDGIEAEGDDAAEPDQE